MAQQFAVQFPQNVNTSLIYDTFKEYYRPFTDKDFAGGYGTAKQSADTNALKALLKLGCSINGTMDTIVLCVYPLGNNALAAYGSVNYRAFL